MNWLRDTLEKILAYFVGFFSGAAYQKWKDRAKNEEAQREALEDEIEDILDRPRTVIDIRDKLRKWEKRLP